MIRRLKKDDDPNLAEISPIYKQTFSDKQEENGEENPTQRKAICYDGSPL
jgi:hypothetical protein